MKNQRHERFAQELAKGLSGSEAYANAGYAPSRSAASRLSSNVSVQARVAELLAAAATKAIVTIDDIVAQLDEDREMAISLKAPAAAVAATMGKAKILGLIVDKSEVKEESVQRVIRDRPQTDEEWAEEHGAEVSPAPEMATLQ